MPGPAVRLPATSPTPPPAPPDPFCLACEGKDGHSRLGNIYCVPKPHGGGRGVESPSVTRAHALPETVETLCLDVTLRCCRRYLAHPGPQTSALCGSQDHSEPGAFSCVLHRLPDQSPGLPLPATSMCTSGVLKREAILPPETRGDVWRPFWVLTTEGSGWGVLLASRRGQGRC